LTTSFKISGARFASGRLRIGANHEESGEWCEARIVRKYRATAVLLGPALASAITVAVIAAIQHDRVELAAAVVVAIPVLLIDARLGARRRDPANVHVFRIG
jgi:hypothetical protein